MPLASKKHAHYSIPLLTTLATLMFGTLETVLPVVLTVFKVLFLVSVPLLIGFDSCLFRFTGVELTSDFRII